MALKNIKAMRPPSINHLSKSTNLAIGTEELLLASKSTYNKSSQARGLECEALIEKFLVRLGFELFSNRLRTPFAEVDLVFTKNKKVYLIEVKSLGCLDFSLVRISKIQKARLLRARLWLESLWASEVTLAFAYVLKDGAIFIFNEAGEELNLKNEN